MFPASLNLDRRVCLVIGGGPAAEKRIRALLGCGASVRVVSPSVTPAIAKWARRNSIRWIRGGIGRNHFDGADLVFGTSEDRSANARIYRWAKKCRCLVNVTDEPALCDFYMPAVIRRGHLTLAVSTDGQSPAFAAWAARRLDQIVSHKAGQILARYARLRAKVKKRYPDVGLRAQVWQELLADESPEIFTPGVRNCAAGVGVILNRGTE
ncbi:MAG: bifunctional precorrin-2 dehydrogenase/sirohydrochlorin ferrochelatase [Acidobacteria bacterium]|nr:bifunctional precorrin-2 dehydrogenase/sirohydrochlorin ferrochelatase [Acidobacteriota bacterium]